MTEAEMQLSEIRSSQAASTSRVPMRISERRLILMGLDLLAVVGALVGSLYLRGVYPFGSLLIFQHPLWFLLLSALWFLVAEAFDAYDIQVAGRFATSAPVVLKTALLTSVVYMLIPYFTPTLPGSRRWLFAFPLLMMGLVTVGRGVYALAFEQPMFQRRALIVGAGWAGCTIAEALSEHGNGSYKMVGFVDDDPDKVGCEL